MSNKNDLKNEGVSELGEKLFSRFDEMDYLLPETSIDNAGKFVGKKVCEGIDKIIDALF